MIRAAVIGVGLIGRERLQALFSLKAEGQQIAIAGIMTPTRSFAAPPHWSLARRSLAVSSRFCKRIWIG